MVKMVKVTLTLTTSSYGAGLTRHLASLGMPVREALSPAGMQRRRPGQGKCDEADAERAARAAMSGSRLLALL